MPGGQDDVRCSAIFALAEQSPPSKLQLTFSDPEIEPFETCSVPVCVATGLVAMSGTILNACHGP